VIINKLITIELEKIILTGLLALTLLILSHNAAALSIISKKVVGNISCDILRISSPAELKFTAVGEVGDKQSLYGSYNLHSNDSLESIGKIINISRFNAISQSFVIIYSGMTVSCPHGESQFNTTITGTCGQKESITLASKVIIGQFVGYVSCNG
jgi:hypothetical protein